MLDKQKLGRPTNEELTLVRDYVLLPHMLTMVEDSIESLNHSTGFMIRLYLAAAFALHNLIGQDLKRLKLELRQKNIKVTEEKQIDLIVYHRIFCRGYDENFGMTREVMKSEIRIKMTGYMDELEKRLNG